ncbi:lithostathine-1-beta-like [Tribolium madens]|uniref:lithostathine-1-beta-like n=1 Tax=Tribolium madens TaxID=41895 RepID=UPI001CF72B40|nr:lithostathine-1-beta-like [Tribolium madens]
MKLIALLLTLALTNAQQTNNTTRKIPKRSYVCPPHFMRLSHRCYYFSKEAATWQDAYFQCRDLHSNLAIVRNSNQDKLIRRTLSKKTLEPLERWLGGLYDWEQMTWKWGASGKPVIYQGFSQMEPEDKEKLRWHCIIVDPKLQFKWNTRSCLEQKHFICHTKIKIVTSKGKKKLLRQYNVNKYNKLNEIPVPTIPEDANYNTTSLKAVNINNAQFALKPKERKRRTRKNKRKKVNLEDSGYNSTLGERRRRQKNKEEGDLSMERMKWKTYYKDSTLNPLHPKPIVEEFNYVKEA